MGRPWLIAMAGIVLLIAASLSASDQVNVFETYRCWTVHLRVSAKQWAMMEPTRAPRLAFLLGIERSEFPSTQPASAQAPEDEAIEGRRLEPNAFGYEYAYVRATVKFDNEVIRDVGLRFQGNGSYASSAWLRRPFKLDFNRFVEDQEFHGLTGLSLHNSAVDPSYMRETLAYGVYRQAEIPASRTSFARVYLTVDGVYERQYLGLYTMVEEVNKRFLKERFGTPKGLLLKPDGIRNLPYLGEDWAEYWRYRPKTDGNEQLRRRFIDFTRLIHYADDETFVSAIESYLDVDGFLRFLAVCTLVSDMDSFLTGSHNFYMYVHPEDQRIRFIPWDMHLAFGGVSNAQAPEPTVHLSIEQPFPAPHRLIERILMVESYRRSYEGYLRQFTEECFKPERLQAEIDRIQTIVDGASKDGVPSTQPSAMPARPLRPMPDLKMFISRRVGSVLQQMAGTLRGYVPGRPAPAPPPPPPPPPRIVLAPARKPVVVPPRQQVARATPTTRRAVTTRPATVAQAKPIAPKTQPVLTTPKPVAATRPVAQKAQPVVTPQKPVVATRPAPVAKPVTPPKPAAPVPKPPHPVVGLLLRSIDADRDNGIEPTELADAACVFFYVAGGTNTNNLDESAIARVLDRIGEVLDAGRIAPLPGTNRPATPPPSPVSLRWAKAILTRSDANGDQRMSLREAIDAAGRWVAQADANRDGQLSQQEGSEALEQLVPR